MRKVQIDLQKLSSCPGLHLAIGWIMAAHDCEAVFHMEELLLKHDEMTEGPSQFFSEHRFYITRLRISQMKEAIGLCIKTQQYSNLVSMINSDTEAVQAFERLHKLNVDGPKANDDMKVVRDIRNNTFHYSLDESSELYAKTISDMIARGERYCEIAQQRRLPDRFELADRLFQNMFFKQLLDMEIADKDAAGIRFNKIGEFLAQVGDDISIVSRSLSQGLLNQYRDRTVG